MTSPSPNPNPELEFVGRKQEGHALLRAAHAQRSAVLVAPPGYGKTALLQVVKPALEERAVTLYLEKLAPFSSFLLELFKGLRANRVTLEGLTYSASESEDLKSWRKSHTNADQQARSLVQGLKAYRERGLARPFVLVDECSSVTASMVPWLLMLEEQCTFVFAVHPATLYKSPAKRLWARFERIDLPPLSPKESKELVNLLCSHYRVVAEDERQYKTNLVSMSGGIPGEVNRLIRFVSAGDIVRRKQVGTSYAQDSAGSNTRAIAIAPIFLLLAAVFMIQKYVSLARGEMDGYVAAGVGIALSMVLLPFARKLFLARD